ncbi:scaffold/adaptor protein [Lithospermum erythrorhizon]|uniref:Tubby-like F-box protein n=1 Tax=Lithospermum erythrorhizon TaxID=34254 RepID=A0AAV3QTE5_LITER
MSFKNIMRDLRDVKGGLGCSSRRGMDVKYWLHRSRSYIAPDVAPPNEVVEQGQWANLPPELLLDIIQRVEKSETSWPARRVVVFCASVCKSWREVTKEIVKTPEECGRLTFPISLKQPGPRDSPIQCFIKRDRATSSYRLYFGLTPSEDESDKLLLVAKRIRRPTSTDFVISFVADEFSRASKAYVGKLRSNFLGTKFSAYDSQPPNDAIIQRSGSLSRRSHAKLVPRRVSAFNYNIAAISYELNVLRSRGPRRMHCVVHSIPVASLQEGGKAPTPTCLQSSFNEKSSRSPIPKGKERVSSFSSSDLSLPPVSAASFEEALVLKNKAPRWHEQLQCWCLNFKGRVTVASVKNFQLVASVDPSHNISAAEQERVLLQFGKIGKDIFTMDYMFPLSAFQAFAICLSSFDTKPACE